MLAPLNTVTIPSIMPLPFGCHSLSKTASTAFKRSSDFNCEAKQHPASGDFSMDCRNVATVLSVFQNGGNDYIQMFRCKPTCAFGSTKPCGLDRKMVQKPNSSNLPTSLDNSFRRFVQFSFCFLPYLGNTATHNKSLNLFLQNDPKAHQPPLLIFITFTNFPGSLIPM